MIPEGTANPGSAATEATTTHVTRVQSAGKMRDGFDAAWHMVSPIEGWLSREQASVLYEAAALARPDSWIVEIGSWHGRSTILLAKAKPPGVGLLTVDPYQERPYGGGEAALDAFCRNARRAGVEREIRLFRGTSEEAAVASRVVFQVAAEAGYNEERSISGTEARSYGEPTVPGVGLLYVDGAHDVSSVLLDIDSWEPLIIEGGVVCFHDAFFRLGVTLALLARHLVNSRFHYLGSVGSLAVFRRERRVPTATVITASLNMLGRFGYLGRNMAVTLGVRRRWARSVLRIVPPEDSCEY
jgi:predicted O-methyltransferase YrrM